MRTSYPKTIILIIIAAFLLSACGKSAAPEPTAIPEPTATPVPPTPTPSPEDILEEAWLAYEEEDYSTARKIAEDVRDDTKAAGNESGEALALLGLIQLETGTYATAKFYLEEAVELGFEGEEISEALIQVYSAQIEEQISKLKTLFEPDAILSEIHHAQENLEKIKSLAPDTPEIQGFNEILQPEEFDPARYVEVDLSINEIELLLTRLENGEILNFSSSYFSDLKEAHPENPIALFFYAVQMLYEDEEEEAIDLLKTSTEIEPGNQSTWLFLGYAYDRVGMVVHARNAYTKTLIINSDNEAAYENLATISDWRAQWEDDYFSDFDFSMQHLPYQNFERKAGSTDTSGVITSAVDFLDFLIQITWQPDDGDHSQEKLQEQMISALDVNSPGFKSTFKPFPFGSIPMVYRDYAYRLPGSSSYADAVLIGAQCDGTNYVFDFRFLIDGEELDELHYLMTVFLETFSCGND